MSRSAGGLYLELEFAVAILSNLGGYIKQRSTKTRVGHRYIE